VVFATTAEKEAVVNSSANKNTSIYPKKNYTIQSQMLAAKYV